MIQRVMAVCVLTISIPIMTMMQCEGKKSGSVKPKDLRCEYRIDPLDVEAEHPRLSWVVQSDRRGWNQGAYHILVSGDREKLDANNGDVWDSGKVESDTSVHAP